MFHDSHRPRRQQHGDDSLVSGRGSREFGESVGARRDGGWKARRVAMGDRGRQAGMCGDDGAAGDGGVLLGLFLRRAEGAGVGLGEGGVGGRGAILIERRGQQAWSEEDMDMGSEVGHGRGDWDGRDPRGR